MSFRKSVTRFLIQETPAKSNSIATIDALRLPLQDRCLATRVSQSAWGIRRDMIFRTRADLSVSWFRKRFRDKALRCAGSTSFLLTPKLGFAVSVVVFRTWF